MSPRLSSGKSEAGTLEQGPVIYLLSRVGQYTNTVVTSPVHSLEVGGQATH